MDCETRRLSGRTLESYRFIVAKLLWFVKENRYDSCGVREIRTFLAYLGKAHESGAGRWDDPHMKRAASARTVETYVTNLRTLFTFFVKEG